MDQPMLIISNEIVSPQMLSLITKTRIRGQDAFKGPGSKDAQGVKALSVLFLMLPLSFFPPFCEANTPCRCQTRQVLRLQNGKPELPCENTRSEDVLNVFLFLVAERAALRMWQSFFFNRFAIQQRFQIANHTNVLHFCLSDLGLRDYSQV